jgi:hypothetical protein
MRAPAVTAPVRVEKRQHPASFSSLYFASLLYALLLTRKCVSCIQLPDVMSTESMHVACSGAHSSITTAPVLGDRGERRDS